MDSEKIDHLIFSPHPDDETLACGGLIINAKNACQKIKIVFLTNGDANRDAAKSVFKKELDKLTSEDYVALGNLRQEEALNAANKMGMNREDVIFLGYPDRRLTRIYKTTRETFSSSYTKLNHTYGMTQMDYHSKMHGVPATFVRESIVNDIASIIETYSPEKIYVSAEFDSHPDHQAAFWFVRDAIKRTHYVNKIFIYVVHGGDDKSWPFPRGKTPDKKIEQVGVDENVFPRFVPWPPSVRLPIDDSINELKLQALYCHASQFSNSADREYYESFIKNEEIFWQINPIYYPNW